MHLYFITGSQGKLEEFQSMLGDVEALHVDLPEIQSLDAHEVVKAKLEEAQKHHHGRFIVEDTSLYFEALNGLPGPFIKWFLETIGNEKLYTIASAFNNFNAEAKTIIGYSDEKRNISFFEGSVKGTIVAPRGQGFGWDPIFQPEGYQKTFGEFSSDEKNAISMRNIALEKLKESLAVNTAT